MTILTVTPKGQVTLRKDLMQHLGVQPGDRIALNKLPDGRIEVAAALPQGHISDVFDLLKLGDHPSLPIEDMNAVIAESWAGRR